MSKPIALEIYRDVKHFITIEVPKMFTVKVEDSVVTIIGKGETQVLRDCDIILSIKRNE